VKAAWSTRLLLGSFPQESVDISRRELGKRDPGARAQWIPLPFEFKPVLLAPHVLLPDGFLHDLQLLMVSADSRTAKRPIIALMNIGSGVKQEFHYLRVSEPHGPAESVVIGRMHLCARSEELFNPVRLAVICGPAQIGVQVLLSRLLFSEHRSPLGSKLPRFSRPQYYALVENVQ
jgi:hypothetical protein